MTTTPKSEFERERDEACEKHMRTSGMPSERQWESLLFMKGANWGREYGRKEIEEEFRKQSRRIIEIKSQWTDECAELRTQLDHLRTKLDQLRAEREGVSQIYREIDKERNDLRSQLDRLEAENKRLREALDKISSGAECSACSCSCHDVARKALGGEE